MNFSLESLVQKLIAKGAAKACSTPAPPDKTPTSIRLKPQTRHFVECVAESLGASFQTVVSMILDGVAEATLDDVRAKVPQERKEF